MPPLGPDDPLPWRPRRVLVAGTSGSGKTTTAELVARCLGTEHVELDALHHGPGWTPRPDFDAAVERFTARPCWVTEWQYPSVRPLLLDRADTLVWLDLPRRVVMRQVVVRTVRRRLRREVLWGTNVEAPLRTIATDRDHIVRWAWRTHPGERTRVAEQTRDRPGLAVVRLSARAQVARWLDGPLRASACE